MQGNKTWCRFFANMMYYLCMCMLTTGTGPGQTIGLNLKSWLYVGGVDWTDVRVSPSVPVDVGFVGCIAEVRPVVSHLSSSSLSSSIILSLHVCHGHERKCNRVDCQTTCLWAQAVLYIRLYFCTAYILLFARLRRVASVLLDWLK